MNARTFATKMAADQVTHLLSLEDLICNSNDFRMEFEELLKQVREERQQELDEAAEVTHPDILQEFAASAGFLIGLEIGRRLPSMKGE